MCHMTCVPHASGLCCLTLILTRLLFSRLALTAHYSSALLRSPQLLLTKHSRPCIWPSRSELWASPFSAWVGSPLAASLYCIIVGLRKRLFPSTLMLKSNLSCSQHRLPFLFPLWKVTEPGECMPVGAMGEKGVDSIPLPSSVQGLALSAFFTRVKQELAHLLLTM